MADTVKNTIARGERVIHRDDGALVLMCESGNPQLGLMLTPGRAGGGIIVSMPEDDRGHPLSVVSIGLGDEQVAALTRFVVQHSSEQFSSVNRVRTAMPLRVPDCPHCDGTGLCAPKDRALAEAQRREQRVRIAQDAQARAERAAAGAPDPRPDGGLTRRG